MPTTVPDTARGITIGFGTSTSFTPQVIDVQLPEESVERVQTSHQGTTVAHTYIPSDLAENDTLEFTIHFDAAKKPPVGATPETITVTLPDTSTVAFSGFIERATHPEWALDGKMMSRIIVKVSGDVTWTPVA
jgi:hypothetical protein